MAGSEYYGDVTVGGRRLNDVTPEEWDRAAAEWRDSAHVPEGYWSECKVDHVPEGYSAECKVEKVDDSSYFNPPSDDIDYKFRESELIEEFKRYIDSTYSGHYGQGGLQSSEIIVDRGHGMGFFSGNIDKYNDRYSKKGDTPDDWRKDIMKTIHYGFLKLFEHDRIHGNNTD